MKDGEETNEEYLDAMNVTGRKIVSEDEGDEDFDLDAAFNEKFSKSKERDEEQPLPEGTIRVKAKTSSTTTSSSLRSSPTEKKMNRNGRAEKDDLAFDPLACLLYTSPSPRDQ